LFPTLYHLFQGLLHALPHDQCCQLVLSSFFALAIASNNVGLPETSAPPDLADTSIALINFANF